MAHSLEILDIKQITHDVKQFTFEQPSGYSFTPGQATEVGVDEDGWREDKHPFTFTSLPDADHLEFTIKIYPEHQGLTNKIDSLTAGDHLLVEDPWGTIHYDGEGVFLAGGAGVTPFIAIFRHLHKQGSIGENKLIFSNKTDDDIILQDEFHEMLGENFVNVITNQSDGEYEAERFHYLNDFVDKDFLEQNIDDFSQQFYVCGPPAFNDAMLSNLKELGANPQALTFEE